MPAIGPNSWWRHPGWIAAASLTILGAAFHLIFFLNAGGFWRDEVNLINLAVRSPLRDAAQDSFPVLMPLVVRGWSFIGLGQTDLGLRSLGLVIGLGLLAALWVAARGTTRTPPLAALALFGINSAVIACGDTLRAYGLGSLLIVLTALGMWEFLKQPRAGRAVLAGVLAVLSVQTLYQNSVLVGAICLGAWAVAWRRKAWTAAAAILGIGLAAAVSLVPYAQNLLAVRQSAAALRTGFSASTIHLNLIQALGFPLPQYLYAWVLLGFVVMVAGIFACLGDKAQGGESRDQHLALELRIFAAATLSAAVAAFAGFLWLAALPTQPWYFLPVMAVAAFCFDAGRPPLPRQLRAPCLGLALATACVSIPYARQDLHRRFTNVDLLAQRLAAEADSKDFVVVAQWYCGLTFERYFPGPAVWTTLPPLSDHFTHRYDLVQAQLRSPAPIQPVLDQIAATLQAGNRVWVVGRMHIPLHSTVAPTSLPPVPAGAPAVSASPFIHAWITEVAHFLKAHSRHFELEESPSSAWISPNEDMQLFCASGWEAGP